MKFLKPRIIIPIIAIFLISATLAVIASPGSKDDPLITLSYINETVIPELKDYINSMFSGDAPAPQASAFTIVNVKAGDAVIGGEGTEFVLEFPVFDATEDNA